MTASGTDITGEADEFHFAYKKLTGPGSITAKVLSVGNTDVWAKAGVMIRETLDPNSKHALACVTPGLSLSDAQIGPRRTASASAAWQGRDAAL